VLVKGGEDAVRALIGATVNAELYSTEWRAGLLRNSEGAPRAILANAIHALRKAPEWQGVLCHNEFATSTVARHPPPWAQRSAAWQDTPWSDRDDYLVAEWLQQQGIMVPASIAGQAVETVARDQTFHPVREYLDALRWDGRPRLDTWLITYLGTASDDYVRAIGARWLISAVARVFIPGAKADCALILEGPQGIKKSTALSVMAQPWFTDRLSDLGSKDAAMETKVVWIIEIAELDTMSRAEVSAIKAFMSRTHDRFRPPYGKRLVDLPRQCVFAGSINPEGGYLKDATGGRRFWPVVCGQIDIDALTRDRDQLWAEARHRFRNGELWWLETPELNARASEEQADRYQGDAWDEVVRDYLGNAIEWSEGLYGHRTCHRLPRSQPLDDVTVGEILENALGIDKAKWTQLDQNRVVRCLVSMGFRQYRGRSGEREGSRQRRYRRARPGE
jgi:predicted P-loop ATPase